jgi:hypothetical protein
MQAVSWLVVKIDCRVNVPALFLCVLGEGEQASTATAQRINNAARLQRDGTREGSWPLGRDTTREATKSLGTRRMDGSLE